MSVTAREAVMNRCKRHREYLSSVRTGILDRMSVADHLCFAVQVPLPKVEIQEYKALRRPSDEEKEMMCAIEEARRRAVAEKEVPSYQEGRGRRMSLEREDEHSTAHKREESSTPEKPSRSPSPESEVGWQADTEDEDEGEESDNTDESDVTDVTETPSLYTTSNLTADPEKRPLPKAVCDLIAVEALLARNSRAECSIQKTVDGYWFARTSRFHGRRATEEKSGHGDGHGEDAWTAKRLVRGSRLRHGIEVGGVFPGMEYEQEAIRQAWRGLGEWDSGDEW